MNHPEDLLAEHAEGLLPGPARVAVDAHLAECLRCREEVSLARAALGSLRRLPRVVAPAGVASRALREASEAVPRALGAAAARPLRVARWIPAAAAAVLVGLLAIALPRLGGGSATQSAPQAASVGASEQAPMPGTGGALSAVLERGVTLERQSKDYGQGDVKALTDDTAAAFAGAELPDTLTKQATFAGAERDALACLFDQIPKSPNTVLVRLIQATYEGQPAYLAIFVHGPAPGEPADRVQTWVVLVKGCTIASLAERVL